MHTKIDVYEISHISFKTFTDDVKLQVLNFDFINKNRSNE